MFVSIHIPKTAGTALAQIFDETSQRRVMYDYEWGRGLEAIRTCPPEIRENRDFIRGYFHYLHGHFHYLRYAEVFADCPFIATVRHPVDRVISQYLHIRRGGDRAIEQHRRILDGDMDIVEFSTARFIGNAQWHFLEGRPIPDYDFIFVQERLDESLAKFCAKFQRKEIRDYLGWMGGVPGVNRKPARHSGPRADEFSADVRRRIAENCALDLEAYCRSLELLDAA